MKVLAYFFRLVFLFTPLKKFYPLFQKRVFGPLRMFNKLTLIVNYGSYRIKLRLEDWIQHHIFFMGEYDSASMRWLENNLRSGDVAIDIGANIGAFTLKMSSLVGNTGRVLAFEPHPYNASQLQENIYLNSTQFNSIQLNSTQFNSIQLNSTLNCRIYQLALGSISGVVEMSNVNFENQGMVKIEANGEETSLKVRCEIGDEIPEIIELDRLDFIKIDTEGYELEVLRGMEKTISKFNPIILLEFDNQLGLDLMPLMNWIEEHDYQISTVRQANVFLNSSDLLKSEFSENIILRR